jgi:Domain of unknown function (DUF4129)
MKYGTKRKTLMLLGLVMLVTVIIAASLPQLDLKPGMPLPRLENGQVVLAPIEEEPSVTISVNEFFKVLFALVLAGSMLYLIYKMILGVRWMDLGSFIQPVMVVSLIAGITIFLIMLLPKAQSDLPMELPLPITTPPVTSPLGTVPVALFWLVGIGLFVSSILLGIWIFTPSSRQETTIDLLGLEAENALQSLRTGLDLQDVIIKCYRQMSLALEKEQGIERKDSMTTREFENLLETAGVPHDPIHQLTQLFEAVRYGHWQPNSADEQKAINCLEAIMLFSREKRNNH